MIKVVIDTNVFVSALLSPDGGSREILRQALSGRLKPVFANALFAEYEALLARDEIWVQCLLSASERDDLLNAVISVADWVHIHFLWRPNLSDEADNHVLELAVAGGAEAIITTNTRDFHQAELLFPDIKILTPGAFLNWRRKP
jgi:putative PIN family toxin of toxin-antitoxin system